MIDVVVVSRNNEAQGICSYELASTDGSALRSFTPYWWLIRPVSGLIRRRLLTRIHRVAGSLHE